MGWTDALEYKKDFDDIVQYLDEMDNFHDYLIGHLKYSSGKGTASVSIEEVIPNKKLQDNTGKVWMIDFEGVENFEMSNDCAVKMYVFEIVKGDENGELLFDLDQGYIRIKARKISLRIPSDVRTENYKLSE